MSHDGRALAADETDHRHHRTPGVASVHVRALITWIAIFPLVAVGMWITGMVGAGWPPVIRALVLTLVVVPTAVYFLVPRLLVMQSRLFRALLRSRAVRQPRPALKARTITE